MVAAIDTMTPAGRMVLNAMRRNLELLIELEKTASGDVAIVVEALISHLRSWKPLAATAVPTNLDTGPVAKLDPLAEVGRDLADGCRYRLAIVDDFMVMKFRDDEDAVFVATLTPIEWVRMRADGDAVAAGIGVKP